MARAASGETVSLEIAPREHAVKVASGTTAPKGGILYIHANGVVNSTSASGVAFMKVTRAKNSDDIVWGVLLQQGAAL